MQPTCFIDKNAAAWLSPSSAYSAALFHTGAHPALALQVAIIVCSVVGGVLLFALLALLCLFCHRWVTLRLPACPFICLHVTLHLPAM